MPLLFLVFALLAALLPAACATPAPQFTAPPSLTIDVLNVGQGDAILLRRAGRAVLYDGGDGRTELVPLLRALGVDSLSLVVASHNHADPIGGLNEVVREYRPRFVVENGLPHTTRS